MVSLLSLSGVPTSGLDMTAEFIPLFVGLVVMLGLSLLGITFAIGVHDTREASKQEQRSTDEISALPKAA